MPARGVPVPIYVILGLLAASAPLRAEPPIKTLAHPARAGKTRPEIIVKYRPEAVVISPILAARKGQSLAQATGKKELASLDRLHQRFGLDLARGRRVFRGAYTGNLPADQKAIRLQASVIQKRFPTRRAPPGLVLPDLSSVFVIPTRAHNVLRACQVLTAHPAVVYAEPNYIYHAVSLPDDTYIDPDQDGTWSAGTWGQAFSDLWGMERIQADQAWANGQIGAGVVVAVIDTGADAAHEDLAINMWINTAEVLGQPGVDDDGNGFVDDIHGYDFVNDDGDPLDDHGHGTHASGTVAAAINGVGVAGVAPGATLMAMKGLNASGAGNTTSLANCLIYAVNNGADVLSNSWGGTGTSQLLTDTFQFAHGMGVVSVGAAGNSNANVASFFPANIAEVIAVAAVDSLDQKASFSNFGELLDVAAPGVDILSLRALDTDFFRDRLHFVPPGDLNAKYYRSNGTSMACPAVAGLAALLRSASPGMTNDQVRQVIRDSADDLGDPGFDLSFGYGRINVAAAMANAVDCNANGVDDALDIASGDSPDCNANGRPDECETGGTQDCNTNGVADLCDLFAGTSDDCQANGVPDDCEPLVDCNTNGLFDPCEIRDGLLPDCNANLIPDPCEINGATDCNTNGIPDACEVGFDQDCNSNGTSDLCDLATGAANDCNSNAVPDTCDLAGGLSGDCNTNGRPDECDLADGSSTDCDADGFPDECMATFRAVLSLATLEGSNGFVIAGLPGTGGAGTSVGAAGDVNNDGYADVMVGAPFIGSFTKLHRGDAYVVFGGPLVGVNGLVNLAELQPAEGYVIQGVGTDHELGRSVAGAGDVNADGLDDVVVGAHGANISVSDLPGTGYVVFGSPTAVDDGIIQAGLLFGRQGFQLPGLDAGDHAGYSVSAAGDVNGDRFDDFLIGAYAAVNPNRPGPGFAAGATYVVFGGASVGKAGPLELGLLNGTDGFALHGDFSTDSTGYSVAGAGDVNGDGLDDFVAGAPFAIGDSPIFGPRLGGECYVVFGRQRLGASGAISVLELDGNIGFTMRGVKRVGYLGFSVTGAGDVNGDGLADLLIGEPGLGDALQLAGTAYVVFGAPSIGRTGSLSPPSLNGANGFSIDGLVATDALGRRVAALGDLNHDGYDDIAVSDNFAVYVIFGGPDVGASGHLSPADLNGANGFTVHPAMPGELFINDVSPAGDVNGDGIDDLLIGIAGANLGQGEAYVIFGRRAPTDCNANNTIDLCESGIGQVTDCNTNGIPDECLALEEDCNTNAAPDACDIANGSSPDCNANGVPDECLALESDCNTNGVPDECDTAGGTSPDCNANGIPDECIHLESDCNTNGVPDECDTANGFSLDCNANTIPDECLALEFDCNANGTPDECDLLAGTSPDCNTNGWPDACDIARQTSLDCNSNGVPDECDVVSTNGSDCNTNGIPDDCEDGWTDDCNTNLIPDLCDLITGGGGFDFNDNGMLDECEPNRTLYVASIECPPDAGTDGPTGTLNDPFCTIQDAIDAAIPGDTVVALDGVYTGPGNRQINFGGRAITLTSRNGPTSCVLDLELAGRGFFFSNGEDNNTVLDGFTITNGAATQGGAIFCNQAGPTFRNCIITDNLALVGGGIYCLGGTPILVNCIVAGNQGTLGGGIYLMSEDARLINCTLADNIAAQGGALACLATQLRLENSIVWNNVADEGPAMFVFAAPPASQITVAYTDIQNGQADLALGQNVALVWLPGNVNVDPAFVNAAGRDYRLSPGSAIIDAGDSTAIGADTLSDVSGLARLVNDLLTPDTGVPDAAGAVVDLGAFEFFETALTAISLLDHNGAELGLNLSNNIEPRAGGVRKILLATGATVANVNATVTCANTVYAGAATVSATSNEVTLTFAPPLPDEDCCAIQLAGDLVGTLTVRALHGDIDRNGQVSTGDASIVRFFFGQTAATAGPQYDVNQDGIITPDDFGSIMPLFNHVAPTCP